MARPPDASAESLAAERRLVERARAGDASAFRELVERHRARAYGLALRILRSAPDAEEVAQDAFVRVWFALPGFRGESTFSTWLFRIVARRAFDRAAVLKSRRRREAGEEQAMQAAVGESSDAAAAETLHARALQRHLSRLTPPQRAAVTLFYYEGQSVERVAELLGLPGNTVKTHLARARAALRLAWLREMEGSGS